MKVEISEHDYGMDITLAPESVEEMAKLLRYSNNASAEKPTVQMSFSNEPYCWIFLKKRKMSVQKNLIQP